MDKQSRLFISDYFLPDIPDVTFTDGPNIEELANHLRNNQIFVNVEDGIIDEFNKVRFSGSTTIIGDIPEWFNVDSFINIPGLTVFIDTINESISEITYVDSNYEDIGGSSVGSFTIDGDNTAMVSYNEDRNNQITDIKGRAIEYESNYLGIVIPTGEFEIEVIPPSGSDVYARIGKTFIYLGGIIEEGTGKYRTVSLPHKLLGSWLSDNERAIKSIVQVNETLIGNTLFSTMTYEYNPTVRTFKSEEEIE